LSTVIFSEFRGPRKGLLSRFNRLAYLLTGHRVYLTISFLATSFFVFLTFFSDGLSRVFSLIYTRTFITYITNSSDYPAQCSLLVICMKKAISLARLSK